MVKSKWVIFGLIVCLSQNTWAQINRYVVFFSDKNESTYSVDSPEEYLSERSIARREKQGLLIGEEDFPVNSRYLDSLLNYEITPFFTSKWLNAALVEAEEENMQNILKTNYVIDYEFVAPLGQLRNDESSKSFEMTFEAEEPQSIRSSSASQLEMLNADDMHIDGFTGEGILIGVFDAGFRKVNETSVFEHIFENDRVLDVMNFTTNQRDVFNSDDHGTSALSCIAAKYNEDLLGTGYDAEFSLYITEDSPSEYRIEEYNWLFAAERADSIGVDIISSSLGYNYFDEASMDYKYIETNGSTSVVSRAAQFASDRGILVINSAGNEGDNSNWPYVVFPADVEDVIAVGAVDASRNHVSFSSVGPTFDGRIKPDVVALGRSTAVLNDRNEIVSRSGTSFSTPLISGLAAGLWQKFPELTNLELKEVILSSGDRHTIPDTLVGHGIPNYNIAFKSNILSIDEVMSDQISVYPNPVSGDYVSVRIGNEYTRQVINFVLISPEGKEVKNTSIKRKRGGDVIKLKLESQIKGVFVLKIIAGGIVKNVKLLRY